MNRAESFPQQFGGSFCVIDTEAVETTRIERATFRTHDELVIEFRLDGFANVVSLLRKSNTFFRGTYTIQDKTGDSGQGDVSCHIFEMPEGPFAFGIWVMDTRRRVAKLNGEWPPSARTGNRRSRPLCRVLTYA
jgi:hypothetical protein